MRAAQGPIGSDRTTHWEPRSVRDSFLFGNAGPSAYAVLILHSIGRHKLLFFALWIGVVALSLGAMAVLPKSYEVETTVQTDSASVIGALGAGTPVPPDREGPSRHAAEAVLSHDNLVALVKQTDFIRSWKQNRAPLPRLKDRLWARLFPPPSPEDELEGFVGLLEKKLWVSTREGTVTIGVSLPDGQLAYRLVEAALQNFLEARHTAEISIIADAITILQARSAQAREEVEKGVRHLEELRSARAARLGKRVPRRPVPQPELKAVPDEESSKLQVKAESVRRAIADLEDFRHRRITELETRLQELKATYSDSHPSVIDVEQSLAAIRQESPQVAALRRDLVPMEAELKSRGLLSDVPLKASRVRDVEMQTLALDDDPTEEQDPEIDYAKAQVRHALDRYHALLDRIQGARLDEDSAQAAFKYRYLVIRPAQRPRGPTKPKPPVVLGAALVAGMLLGVLGTALVDLTSGKVLEPWQVEHQVGVPLLAEVRRL
jgi:uncharacterized protein involved in exopolysaccharide biosynthesis